MSARYEFIDAERESRTPAGDRKYTVVAMCRWLEVSTSGYYEWRERPDSATARRREYLQLLIRKAFDDSDETYGYRRLHAQLARWGEDASPELVRALMRELGLVPCQPRPWRASLTRPGATSAIPDLVGRDFTADTPGTKMVGDVSYIPTWEGWLYLATVLDCHTKAVTGYAMADHHRAELVCAAVDMMARNYDVAPDAVFHSDRGSNYTSAKFDAKLGSLGIRQSVGRTGTCFDNALAESFFGALKTELVHRTVYPTRERARRDIARYIEIHYNTKRLHSGLGYKTPNEVYTEYLNGQAAA